MSGTGLKASYLTPLDEVATRDKEGVGTHRYEDGKWYKWLKLQNTTATVALVAGDPVAYGAADGYQNNLVVGDMTDADAAPVCAGCVNATIAGVLATAYYCWVQIKGFVTIPTAITSGADGVPVVLTTTDKTLAKAVEADTAGNYKAPCGIALDASDKTVVLDCPF